ncbi:hypothetical protein ABG768_019088, partial [Culter alburnus]
YGQECIFIGPTSGKFKSAPLSLTEEVRAKALEALCPSSHLMSGKESDLFTKGGYITLSGY